MIPLIRKQLLPSPWRTSRCNARALQPNYDLGQSTTVNTSVFFCLNGLFNNPQMGDANGAASSPGETLLMLSRPIEIFFHKD